MVSAFTEFATKLRSEKVQPFVQTEGALREVHDTITDLLKQLANEPSVGLYFVQQHVHKAVPSMVSLKAQMADNTQEVEYVTEDVRDALNSVRSMKEVGPAVIERMIKTLDISLPRLASLRPSKRDGYPWDSLTRSGEYSDSLLMDPSEKQSSSPRSPSFISVEQNSANPTLSSSGSVDTQNLPVSNGVSSAQVSLDKEVSAGSTSGGDYSGYMRTMFDSALQKASSVKVAHVTKWNTYGKGTKLEKRSTEAGEDMRPNIKSGADSQSTPSVYVQNVLATAFKKTTSFAKTAPEPSAGTSTSKEILPLPRAGEEAQEFSGSSFDRTSSLQDSREVMDYGKPGQYVRAVFGSARQRVGNLSREGSKPVSPDGNKSPSTVKKPLEGWSWLQVPTNALLSFNKQPQTQEGLMVKEATGSIVIHDQVTSESESKQAIQQLLDIERGSYEAFAAEKAAKLEEWLQDTEEGDRKDNE